MSLATIMVHVDADQASDRRLRLAHQLARRFDATLIAVAAQAVEPRLIGGGDIVGDDPDARDVKRVADALDELGKHARATIGSPHAIEWRSAVAYPTEFVVREAATTDLLVVGRDPADNLVRRSLDIGQTVIKTGRPVLIVPSAITTLNCRRILIAWKNTRQARRALRDAVPLLQLAEEIVLLEYTERTSQPSTPDQLAALATYLARHGVPPPLTQVRDSKLNIARELIEYAQGFAAELIVAGGYGLHPLGEFIFGGVTRDLIANSPTSCLLSH
jgi:nucleotide-binding universal stress UspA family protein